VSTAGDERARLCDLFTEVGPDAPTLCGSWTTRDLAAHLVMRERRPDGAVGIVAGFAAGHAEKVQAGIAATEWGALVDTVRSGPPIWSPTRIDAVDRLANTVEFFVHHEDVRRAAAGWQPRSLDPELTATLYGMLKRLARRLVRRSPVGVVLEPTDDAEAIVAKDAEPSVTVRGAVGELVMFAYGRQDHAVVETFGDAEAVAAVMDASFGV
jgi:uncharacterized protein (TIGR03085 family)